MNRSSCLKIFFFALLIFTFLCPGQDLDARKAGGTRVILRAHYKEPDSLRRRGTIVVDGFLEGEYVELTIKGTIRDFQLVRLAWDEAKNLLVEQEITRAIDEITDRTVIIKTSLPEGIPSEKIKWRCPGGNTHEFVLQENGLEGKPAMEYICK